MIRFILIGDQISDEENQCAFFDTVTDQFLKFDGRQVFDDREDFIDHGILCEKERMRRCIAAIPEDYK